jgi:hypothetical protein
VPGDRYEPMPGVAELPRWLWRRFGRGAKVAIGIAAVALVAVGIAVLPGILDSKEEREASERAERAERREARVRELREEMRPRFGSSASVAAAGAATGQQLSARAGLMDDLEASILADARRRVRAGELEGSVERVRCEPFPRSVDAVGADEDLSRRSGRWSCVASVAELEGSEETLGVVIGHRYRAVTDFAGGDYAYCKLSGQAGPQREQLATVPEACGGD